MLSAARFRYARNVIAACCAACLCLFVAGCVQIEHTITLNEDRSGTIIEVIRFDDRLVQSASANADSAKLLECLKEEHIKDRIAYFGEVTVASHEVTDLFGKGREARTVYSFKDINKISVPALPYHGDNWAGQVIAFKLGEPTQYFEAWRNAYYMIRPLEISYRAVPNPPKPPALTEGVKLDTPLDKERLRALLPVARAMLEGFHASVKLQAYAPIGVSKTHVIYELKDSDLSDDETLVKVLEWNRAPDPHLGEKGGIGREGRLMAANYSVNIQLPSAPGAPAPPPEKPAEPKAAPPSAAPAPAPSPAPAATPAPAAAPAPAPAAPAAPIAEQKPPELNIEALKGAAPPIDGTVDSPAWKAAASSEKFSLNEGSPSKGKTKLYVTRDEKNLYIAVQCFEAPEALATLKAATTEHDADDIWADDSVELFIDPANKRESYYQLIVNSKGVLWDVYHAKPGEPDASWESHAQVAAKVGKDSWTVTLALPLANFDRTKETGAEWAFNVAHNRTNAGEMVYWSPVYGGSSHRPERFGKLTRK